MRAFIIRPFGTQSEIDFDSVEAALIGPALEKLQVSGRTTLDIMRAGNIRIDMFQRLLTADIVVADLSIHNANVFYELGIRHSLRSKRTVLLRCNADKFPFDLQTDRYLVYDRQNPAAALDQLVSALRQTRDSEEVDSPVFRLLPDLVEQDRSRFLAVPLGFREEVERAEADQQRGDLELLGEEVRGFEWESEGLRLVGRAQFRLTAFEGARRTWEALRGFNQADLEANTVLGTVYQRLGDLTKSNQAVRRVLERRGLDPSRRAEVRALLGRNAKALWTAYIGGVAADQLRQQALRSSHLGDAYEGYFTAFCEDLNHFYSGLNALGMLVVQTQLAEALPEVWEERFETSAAARRELKSRRDQVAQLAASVELSLGAAKRRLVVEEGRDLWAEISAADLCCLTSKKPARVASAYREALDNAGAFARGSVRAQLRLYEQLGVMPANVAAALAVIAPAEPTVDKQPQRVLLFTGHMIDAPDRPQERFPARLEGLARERIRHAVIEEKERAAGRLYGIAGGACGGDILFHEVCAELEVPTQLYLPLPEDKYVVRSVQRGGPQWIERFRALCQRLPIRRLADSVDDSSDEPLPVWLREKPSYTIFRRANLWMLHHALSTGAKQVTVVALWNGEPGDGEGGTSDMLQRAAERGAKAVVLDTKEMLRQLSNPT